MTSRFNIQPEDRWIPKSYGTELPPGFEEMMDNEPTGPPRVKVTAAGMRLHWKLNGSLEDSITVAPKRYYEPGDTMEPYLSLSNSEAISSDQAPALHPISQEPIFELQHSLTQAVLEEKVTSRTVTIECLKEWAIAWDDAHYKHADPDDPRHWCQDYDYGEGAAPLIWCCGMDRPQWKDATLQVDAAGEFLTVHEYVSAVHPWLMSMRARILHAYNMWQRSTEEHLPDDTELVVLSPKTPLSIGLENVWIKWRTKI